MAGPGKRGRSPKYTEERIERFLDAIKAGSSRNGACKRAGICQTTLYKWLSDPDKQDFAVRLAEAEAELEMRLAATVQMAAAGGNWQAAMTMLERKWPEHWARSEKLRAEHTGPDGRALQIMIVPPGVVKQAAEELKAATNASDDSGA